MTLAVMLENLRRRSDSVVGISINLGPWNASDGQERADRPVSDLQHLHQKPEDELFPPAGEDVA